MLQLHGVGLTDEVNLYNQRFTLKAMYNAYEKSWKEGLPSFINHDHRRHIGWTKLGGIYLEPHKAYSTNTMYIGETAIEKERLQKQSYDSMFYHRVIEQQEKYDSLVLKLGSSISMNRIATWVNAVSFYDIDIVKKVFPQLCAKMDDDGLIDLAELNPVMPGIYEKDGYLIFAHHYFRRGFSRLNTLNEPFLELIEEVNKSYRVKIAIDMDCIGLSGTQQKEFEYQYWWGPIFNDELTQIPLGVTVYDNDKYDGYFSDVRRTEFGWYIQNNKHAFECEEIIDIPNIIDGDTSHYGCRYVHSMVNNSTNLPDHLDGAIREYTDEKMIDRLDISIKDTERNTIYTKLWRIDADIDIALWKELISHYFRDNMLIGEYFGGVDKKIDQRHKIKSNNISTEIIPLKQFVPSDISSGEGIRVNISCHPIEIVDKEYHVIIRPVLFYNNGKDDVKFVESETVTLYKLLSANGIKIRFPYSSKIATEDMIFNFPVLLSDSPSTANIIINCFERLCVKWVEKGDNRLLSYSIRINYDSKSILYSFAGHVKDFIKFYKTKNRMFPEKEDAVSDWIENTYSFMNNAFPPANNVPPLRNILSANGVLSFERKFIDNNYIVKSCADDTGLLVTLKVPKDELDCINDNNISMAAMFEIANSSCSNCNKEYFDCNCIKFINESVTERITNAKLIGCIWTNRSAICKPKKQKL